MTEAKPVAWTLQEMWEQNGRVFPLNVVHLFNGPAQIVGRFEKTESGLPVVDGYFYSQIHDEKTAYSPISRVWVWPENAPAPDPEKEFPAHGFHRYEEATLDTAIYPDKGTGNARADLYTLEGICGETGEYVAKRLPAIEDAIAKLPRSHPLHWHVLALRQIASAGLLLNDFSKAIRRGEIEVPEFAEPTEEERDGWLHEIGDIGWFVVRHAAEKGFRFVRVLVSNITKLRGRKVNNTIEGSGDKR